MIRTKGVIKQLLSKLTVAQFVIVEALVVSVAAYGSVSRLEDPYAASHNLFTASATVEPLSLQRSSCCVLFRKFCGRTLCVYGGNGAVTLATHFAVDLLFVERIRAPAPIACLRAVDQLFCRKDWPQHQQQTPQATHRHKELMLFLGIFCSKYFGSICCEMHRECNNKL